MTIAEVFAQDPVAWWIIIFIAAYDIGMIGYLLSELVQSKMGRKQ